MNSTNETILNIFESNHLISMISLFRSNDGTCREFNIAYKGILGSPEITPYEELETLLRCTLLKMDNLIL